jgi:hypothetical protein
MLKSHSAQQFATGTDWLLTVVIDGLLSRLDVSEG